MRRERLVLLSVHLHLWLQLRLQLLERTLLGWLLCRLWRWWHLHLMSPLLPRLLRLLGCRRSGESL